jgi:hypothetical protein
VGHLQNEGFQIKTVDMSYDQLNALKKQHGVPPQLNSCHTGLVGDYVIEGHVPGDIILRFLKEKPDVAGIGVPGMPVGSPGMPGALQPYDVFTFDRKGQVKVYAHVGR